MIYEVDIDFGEIENVPQITKEDPNRLDKQLHLDYFAPIEKK